MYRQGDVLLVRTDEPVPESATAVDRDGRGLVLAHGEATGHAHRIASVLATLYVMDKAYRLLHVEEPTELVHEEHGTIPLDPGMYRVFRQREYTPEGIRNVAD